MKKRQHLFAAVVAVGAVGLWVWTSDSGAQGSRPGGTPGAAIVEVTVPELTGNAVLGERAFNAYCVACHGQNAAGVEGSGPPLVHKIYEPSHHADFAFQLAVQQGVRAHHWRFGNMPPVEGITKAEVRSIVDYVRALQAANGI